ncbi:hypothetical protein P7C73_g627, partial [Tremellales sp. Uapishka_1]
MAASFTVTNWDDFDYYVNITLPTKTIPVLKLFAETISNVTRHPILIRSAERKDSILEKVQAAFRYIKSQSNLQAYGQIRQRCDPRPQAPRHYPGPPTFGGSSQAGGSYYGSAPVPPRYPPYPNAYDYDSSRPYGAGGSSWRESTQNGYNRALSLRCSREHTSLDSTAKADLSSSSSRPFDAYPTRLEAEPNVEANQGPYEHGPASWPSNTPVTSATVHVNNKRIPVDYPANPDVDVDDYRIEFRERGLRGKAGSAPPFDLDKSSKGLVLHPERMCSVTMRHTGPTVGKRKEVHKKFWFQIVLAEMTTKEELLASIKKLSPTNAQDALDEMRRKAEEDDDIEVGISRMTLKDPLAYTRITTPIRSSKCTHLQCFDAYWWLEGNSQHPQFLCPLCNKELQFDDLIIDGYVSSRGLRLQISYFLDILKACPETVDEVVIEPKGDWHTEDNKFGSTSWLAQHPSAASPSKPSAVPTPRESSESPDTKGKRKAIEILSSSDDDDDDDVPLSKVPHRSTSSRQASIPSRPTVPLKITASRAVIDLTEDSEDDDEESSTYFRQPGATSTSLDVADSFPLPVPNRTNQGGSAARSNGGGVRGDGLLGLDDWASLGFDFRADPLLQESRDTRAQGHIDKRIRSGDWMSPDYEFGAPLDGEVPLRNLQGGSNRNRGERMGRDHTPAVFHPNSYRVVEDRPSAAWFLDVPDPRTRGRTSQAEGRAPSARAPAGGIAQWREEVEPLDQQRLGLGMKRPRDHPAQSYDQQQQQTRQHRLDNTVGRASARHHDEEAVLSYRTREAPKAMTMWERSQQSKRTAAEEGVASATTTQSPVSPDEGGHWMAGAQRGPAADQGLKGWNSLVSKYLENSPVGDWEAEMAAMFK